MGKAVRAVNNTTCVIIVIAAICYTLILGLGFLSAVKQRKRHDPYKQVVKHVIDEIKDLIHKEEIEMDKGAYKNTRSSEMGKNEEFEPVLERDSSVEEMLYPNLKLPTTPGEALKQQLSGMKKAPNLTSLITRKATDEEYEEILDLLTDLAKFTYNQYKFFIAKSPDETEHLNFVSVVSFSEEAKNVHAEIFRKGVAYGIDMVELSSRFAKRAALGKVLDLGEDVVIITDDGTGNPPTGVSPINSGIEGGEIRFNFSFIKKDNYEAWEKKAFPKAEGEDQGE
ncbi:hypothetical protein [Bacillus phage SBSphiJ4]|nr:hypothetical protein [Bacillus phage SBSphiJ2]UPI12561.1 hypothetical protein [Bacillus phage SBSphiJ4]